MSEPEPERPIERQPETPQLVSIAEAATLTGTSKKAIRSRVDRGSLPFVLEDGVRKIDVADLVAAGLLNDNGDAPAGADLAAAPRQEAGGMLVPMSDWQRLMEQVSNVFELSRELADTSARAAKAETQAEFFRERFQEERRRAEHLEEQLAERNAPVPPSPAPQRRWFGLRRD